jgi:hypothetical protein
MKSLSILSVFLALTFAGTSASAQLPVGLSIGPRIGTETENNDFFAGGQVELKMPFITLAPNYEYVFVKDAKSHVVNLDLQYTMYSFAVAKMFVGGGYVINIVDPDGLKSVTNNGFNAQVGAKGSAVKFNFFGLARYNRIEGEDSFALVVGTNFNLF